MKKIQNNILRMRMKKEIENKAHLFIWFPFYDYLKTWGRSKFILKEKSSCVNWMEEGENSTL